MLAGPRTILYRGQLDAVHHGKRGEHRSEHHHLSGDTRNESHFLRPVKGYKSELYIWSGTAATYSRLYSKARMASLGQDSVAPPTFSLRKEVIQPQVLLRLPCYDFTPIMSHTLGHCLLAVSM